MGQHIVLPNILPNKASRSVLLDIVQPIGATLQATSRSVEFDPPEVYAVRFEMELILPTGVGEMLD
jgi:hypothetical protein